MIPALKALLALAFALPSLCFAGSSIDLLVVAEQADRAAKPAPPSPEHPVYYLAYDAGYIEAGDPIAGLKPPSPTSIGHSLRLALAAAGYEAATALHAPSLVLVYSYGSLRRDSFVFTPRYFVNPNLKAQLDLIAPKLAAQRALDHLVYQTESNAGYLTPETRETLDLARDARYFLIVSAYDYADLTRQTPTLRWRARLSALETSGAMNEVLPTLAGASAPYLGRNFDRRQFRSIPPPFGSNPVATTPPFVFPPEAAEKIATDILHQLLRQERVTSSGNQEKNAAVAFAPPAVSAQPPVDHQN